MLSILLTILKIIGIVLAVLLGLVIVLLLVLLFVPLHYDILASYSNDKPYAKVNVTALFKLVRVRMEYIDNVTYWVKVLFFKVFPKDEDDKDNADKKDSKKSSKKDKKSDKTVFDEEESLDDSKEDPGNLDYQMSGTNSSTDKSEQSGAGVDFESANVHKDEDEPKGFFERIVEKISSVYHNIVEKLFDIKEKIVAAWESIKQKKEDTTEKVNDILRIIKDEGNQEFVKFVWEQIKYLLKKLKPKKGYLNAHFGMDDPETTGKIAMYLAVAYGLLGIDVNIQPDFEQKIIEGELYLKGRLQLVTIVIIAVRLYRNKHFKRIVLKKEL